MNSYTPGAVPASGVPENVPIDRVFQVDAFHLDGIEEGYQEACKKLQSPDMPNLIWTPLNGGHWIVTRGSLVREVLRTPSLFFLAGHRAAQGSGRKIRPATDPA